MLTCIFQSVALGYMRSVNTREWIKTAKRQGWMVSAVHALEVSLKCSKQGCSGAMTIHLNKLTLIPDPCDKEHFGQYSAQVFQYYIDLVAELVRRRRLLGLSQEEICAASGLADGHVNKLEAFHRIAQFPTLQLWTETLGMKLVLKPAPMPPATVLAIEQRPAPMRKTRTKPQEGTSNELLAN